MLCIKNRVCLKSVSALLLSLSLSMGSSAQTTGIETRKNTADHHQCLQPSVAHSRFSHSEQSIFQYTYQSNPELYVDVILPSMTVVDARQRSSSVSNPRIDINQALMIPYDQLKTKSYLKNKPLLLVGNGVNTLPLEIEVDKLLKQGFSNIKILKGGITRLLGTPWLDPSVSVLDVLSINARQLLALSYQDVSYSESVNKNNPLPTSRKLILVNLETEAIESYEQDDGHITVLHTPYEQGKSFALQLKNKISHTSSATANATIVLVHKNPEVYRSIYRYFDADDAMRETVNSRLWFLKGGYQVLQQTQRNIALAQASRSKVRVECRI